MRLLVSLLLLLGLYSDSTLLERPWWRSGSEPTTSQMVREMQNLHTTGKIASFHPSWRLLHFVDTSGELIKHTRIPLHPVSETEFIKGCIPHVNFPEEDMNEVMQLYDAMSYARERLLLPVPSVSLDDLLQIQLKVVGNSSTTAGYRDKEAEAQLMGYLAKLNMEMARIHKLPVRDRFLPACELTAWSIWSIRRLQPFLDGNARVSEVINSVILGGSGVTHFPFRIFNVWSEAGYHYALISMKLTANAPTLKELTAFVIEKAWLASKYGG